MSLVINKLLIANRGEIACRVIRTARRMGIATVAVHSDADAGALHVELADEAVRIGTAPAAESYLRHEAVLDAARASGADAIHPGYGFLSENAAFARACAQAGVCFVGPPVDAIVAMGSKREALALMAEHGVPVLPGYRGETQDDAALVAAAEQAGFPVIVKPSAGGGGKGMQVARDARELAKLLPATRRVARAAFGDDTLLLERYLERPRHVEIQVFADAHGNCIHLFERDCSVQRRHQKIVEEAPAPDLPQDVATRMGQVAVRAAQVIGYRGAGTVEFLYDPEQRDFHFMEMNTRLQVEHPVTEMITGVDLVEWQLRVAAGEALPMTQEQVPRRGHAIEVRLYAEDPSRDFLPATGTLHWLTLPEDAHTRVDTGVRRGDAVGVHYDPMIAKLIVHGADRGEAVARLRAALARARIGPLASNVAFLRAVAAHPEWAGGAVDTGFLGRRMDALQPARMTAADALLAAALWLAAAPAPAAAGPWERLRGFRLNLPPAERARLAMDGDPTSAEPVDVSIEPRPGGATVRTAAGPRTVSGVHRDGGLLEYREEGRRVRLHAWLHGDALHLDTGEATAQVRVLPTATPASSDAAHGAGALVAPMPGRVVALHVAAGDRVEAGQALVVLEAMKMEHTLTAPGPGSVEQVGCAEGVQVEEGVVLVALALD